MINVPISQSIRFRPVDANRFNFDNTFNNEGRYIQYVDPSNLTIQVNKDVTDTSFPNLYIIECNGTETEITGEIPETVGDRIFLDFIVDFSAYEGKRVYFSVREVFDSPPNIERYRSEWVTVQSQPTFFKLNWHNNENAFLLDYSRNLVNEMFVQARFDEMDDDETVSIYQNQGIDTILKANVSRIAALKFDAPDYICEQITLAMRHDHFYVNEIEFTVSKKPEKKQLGMSKMYSFSAELKQKTILGLNSHDNG